MLNTISAFISRLTYKGLQTDVERTVQQACEISRPPIGGGYSDATATANYREWVYTCSQYNANAVATANIRLLSKTRPRVAQAVPFGDEFEILRHPIIDLLDKPNEFDTRMSFLFKLQLFLELCGDAYIYTQRDRYGMPVRLEVLFSQHVNILHDQNRVIAYTYGAPVNGRYQFQFTPDEITHIMFFDPDDLLYGISPLQACARANGLSISMDTYEEALNRNMGVPSGVLNYKSDSIREDDRAVIETKWQKKFASVGRAGKLLVTDQDVDFKPIGVVPRDMQFTEGRRWSRETVFGCYGIPQALLLTESVNRSNMVQASVEYHRRTLEPRLALIDQALTTNLLKGTLAEGARLQLYSLPPTDNADIVEAKKLRLEKAKLLVDAGAITPTDLALLLQDL